MQHSAIFNITKTVSVFLTILCAVIFAAAPLRAQNAAGPEPAAMIGILGLPALCYWDCKGYDEPVPLFYEPDPEAVPATYLLYNDIENWPDFLEYNYEMAGALVYERQGKNWYKIKRHDEFFWVQGSDQYEYLPYPDILYRRLAFLITRTGIPLIRDEPDMTQAGQAVTHPVIRKNYSEVPVEILETKEIEGTSWVKVNILENHICLGDTKTILHTGWIPAYDNKNNRNFWYYPRGC